MGLVFELFCIVLALVFFALINAAAAACVETTRDWGGDEKGGRWSEGVIVFGSVFSFSERVLFVEIEELFVGMGETVVCGCVFFSFSIGGEEEVGLRLARFARLANDS